MKSKVKINQRVKELKESLKSLNFTEKLIEDMKKKPKKKQH